MIEVVEEAEVEAEVVVVKEMGKEVEGVVDVRMMIVEVLADAVLEVVAEIAVAAMAVRIRQMTEIMMEYILVQV